MKLFCDIKQENTKYFDKSWDLFGNHSRKRKCCVVLSLVKEKLEHLQCEQASYDIKQREYKIF